MVPLVRRTDIAREPRSDFRVRSRAAAVALALTGVLASGTSRAIAAPAPPTPSATPVAPAATETAPATSPRSTETGAPSTGGITPDVPRPAPSGAGPGSGFAGDPSKYHTQINGRVKYSLGLRTLPSSKTLVGNIGTDDGDRNFGAGGVTSNRLDVFSEVDVANQFAGIRLSGEAWYDTIYRGTNANTSPQTINQLSPQYDAFTSQTRKLSGEDFLLLDAFAFGNVKIGKTNTTLRAGRHALQWGETLFFGNNGIANGMAPIDLVKLLAVPNTQFKELILPVNQFSTDIQLSPEITLGAYYQLQWQKNLIPPVGSYLSSIDSYDEGAQRIFIGGPLYNGGPLASLGGSARQQYPTNNGQFGLRIGLSPKNLGYDLGLYALQYSEHVLSDEIFNFGAGAGGFPGKIGEFYPTYAQGIQTYGGSFSTTIGDFNIASEVSMRNNAPLESDSAACGALPGLPPGVKLSCGNNSSAPIYATGRTLHVNGSFLWGLTPNKFAKESNLAAELAYNDVLKVQNNPNVVDSTTTRSAAAFRFVYTPVYRQFRPGVDLSVPIGLGYGLVGKTTALGPGEMPAGGTGDFSVGLGANFSEKYNVTLGYVGYIGRPGNFLDGLNHNSLQQTLADRNFLALSISHNL